MHRDVGSAAWREAAGIGHGADTLVGWRQLVAIARRHPCHAEAPMPVQCYAQMPCSSPKRAYDERAPPNLANSLTDGRTCFMRRLIPWFFVGTLFVLTIGMLIVSAGQAPRYFDFPAKGSQNAIQRLRLAVLSTESVSSFTETTIFREPPKYHGQLGVSAASPVVTVYQAPYSAESIFPKSSLAALLGNMITVGHVSYSEVCGRWTSSLEPLENGPQGVFLDLDYLYAAQRVEEKGSHFTATYVPPFPEEDVRLTALVRHDKVVSDIVSIRYGKGTSWYRSLSADDMPESMNIDRYTRFNSSPPVVAPPKKDVTKDPNVKPGVAITLPTSTCS